MGHYVTKCDKAAFTSLARSMTMMTFADFFQAIYPILAKGRAIHVFARDIFDQILDTEGDPDYVNPLYEVQENTIRKYVDPNDTKHNLPKRKVSGMRDKIEPVLFATYLGTYSDETLQDLATALKPELSDVTPHNVCDKCADLFKDTLIAIISPPKPDEQITLFEYMPPTVPQDIVQLYGERLVVEADAVCPRPGCTALLKGIGESGNSIDNYQVVQINPSKPMVYENLLSLCPACANRYLTVQKDMEHPVPYIRQMEELEGKKRELMASSEGKTVMSRYDIEKGVDRLLRNLQESLIDLSDEELKELKLEYDPVEVRQKLRATTRSEKFFLQKILRRVISYYNLVDNNLVNLNKERIIRQHMFSLQIKMLYHDLNDKMADQLNSSQEDVYDMLVDWLHEKTGEDKDLCQIVIAYFIQSCEVFDVITE